MCFILKSSRPSLIWTGLFFCSPPQGGVVCGFCGVFVSYSPKYKEAKQLVAETHIQNDAGPAVLYHREKPDDAQAHPSINGYLMKGQTTSLGKQRRRQKEGDGIKPPAQQKERKEHSIRVGLVQLHIRPDEMLVPNQKERRQAHCHHRTPDVDPILHGC